MLNRIAAAYNSAGIVSLLPTFPEHTHWEYLGLPAYFHKQLLLALEYPTSTYPGGFGTLADVQVNSSVREVTCLNIDHSIYSRMSEIFTDTVSRLTQQYFGLPATPCGTYGIFRYDAPTGHYVSHCDAGTFFPATDTVQIDYPCRHISFVYYPHNNFIGGELEISPIVPENAGTIVVTPKADHFILFPSDVRYPHKVRATLEGSRIAIVNWFSLRGQTDGTAHEDAGIPRPIRQQ